MTSLNKAHLRDLRKSGLTDETIEACGFYSATSSEVQELLGYNAGPGLACPFFGTRGAEGSNLVRVKLDAPTAKMKYASPTKKRYPAGNRLYLCPLLISDSLENPEIELVFTEGEKKAAAACQAGIQAIGLTGVWGWKGRDSDDRSHIIHDLDLINFENRSVAIIFDSDAADNSSILAAELAFRRELESRGTIVFIVRIPPPNRKEAREWGTKFGIDDFIEARGIDELRHLISWSRNPMPLGCRSVSVLESLPDRDRLWLVREIWKVSDCGFLAGQPKTMKSLLALDLAICVATGEPFLDRAVTSGTVIVVDEETNFVEFRNRLRSLAEGRGLAWPDLENIHFLEKGSLRLDDPDTIEELRKLCRIMEPRLIILDPFVRMHQKDENSSQEMSPMLGALRRVSDDFNVSIMIVHHFNKSTSGEPSGRMRGSSDLHGWYDGAIFTQNSGKHIKLSFAYRYGNPVDDFLVSLESDGDRGIFWEVVDAKGGPSPISIEEQILEMLRHGPRKVSDIGTAMRRSGSKIKTAIEHLVAKKKVMQYEEKTGIGRPSKIVRLCTNEEDFLYDDFNSLKNKKEVIKSKSVSDFIPSGSDGSPVPEADVARTDNGLSDSASALPGSSCVRNTSNDWAQSDDRDDRVEQDQAEIEPKEEPGSDD